MEILCISPNVPENSVPLLTLCLTYQTFQTLLYWEVKRKLKMADNDEKLAQFQVILISKLIHGPLPSWLCFITTSSSSDE